ncbi:MAG: hypothetical protein KF894_09845 [Labilithrix sp.]|nr:hypothetical protein [Labilithrix sp.]
MAYLNVRERRIETKIAYVGPELAGKTTNLQHLKGGARRARASDLSPDGDALSLDWRPLEKSRFDDCELTVQLVASRGSLSTERLDTLLEDSDGVVVVVDAAPTAREENLRTLSLVREALARPSVRRMPVVVQLNKTDLSEAISASEVASSVEWPIVTASAVRGEGVVETLETALSNVIASFDERAPSEPRVSSKMNEHPLLGALKEILRETVSEHMATVARDTSAKIASAVAAHLAQTERAVEELREAVAASTRDLSSALAVQERTIAEISLRLVETQAMAFDLATRRDVEASESRVRDDLSTQARAEREHMTAAAAVIRRGVEALGVDLKKQDARDKVVQLAADQAELGVKLESLTKALAPTAASIGALQTSLQREMRESVVPRLARIEDSVQVMHVDTGESLQRADERTGEIKVGLDELLDELRKRKKGWFS